MSEYRSRSARGTMLGGRTNRALRALLSARELVIETWGALERVVARGRETRDPEAEEDGQFEGERVPAEYCQPIGWISRPGPAATVEAVVGHVGADGANPYILATIDHGRSAILDARSIDTTDRSLVIVYNDTDVIELHEGKIRLGSLGGTTEPLATRADLQAVVDHFNDHVHVEVTQVGPAFTTPPVQGTPQIPLPDPAPDPAGTQRVEAE